MLDITWGRVLRIWWLIAWRSLTGAVFIGVVIGAIVGFVGALAGVPRSVVTLTAPIIGGVVGLGWGVVVIRMALKKNYRGFRLALIAT
jgi:hypothetical protein